jgi:hypothetical protein
MQACLNIAERRRFNEVNFWYSFLSRKKYEPHHFIKKKGAKQGKISIINRLLHYVQKNVYIPHTVLPVIPKITIRRKNTPK